MNAYDITLTIIILLVFFVLFLAPFFSIGIQKIKDNWVEYRCNPMAMPFAGFFGENPTQTFTFCIQSMLKDFMGYLLIPLQQSITMMHSMGGGLESSVNNVRKMISAVRTSITEIVESIFGVLLNTIVEIQKLMVNLKDLMAKIVGIMTTLLFMVYGSMQTMQSAWNGPPGHMVRSLCFRSTTKIQLFNGELREIKQLNLGDRLKDGGLVEAVLKLKNTSNEYFYILDNGEKKEDIYVTGRHMIQNRDGQFIPVEIHIDSKKTEIKDEIVYCLVTSTNRILIGERTFWDWNDDEVANNNT